ncbi:MAG: hypothetical protein LPJ89_04265 [Hymenobacteraceae bacterium]|nr:hypothetical protein [Hymenobacteraceae bacterium]MDX5396275.1 hypothetical protein [Hymenobacteraceae bacterium]MDX5442979.1 hypothetical protein [Hymenobacteraceae bacterium]MDX5512336.1 hypothetical protein [Hymenobacteraceae bacterium]
MNYQRTKAGQKLAEQALTKAVVYFKDGNSRTFHSRDKHTSQAIVNKQLGINRLRNYINKNAAAIGTAIIYDKESDMEIYKFKEGRWE